MTVNFHWVESKLDKQLGEHPTLPTFYTELEFLRRRVALADSEDERRSIAGQIGGLVKRWKGFIIAELTVAVLGVDAQPGRERVREWQKAVFGKSCSSMRLAAYAKTARSGGGRGEPVKVPAGVEVQAREVFDKYASRLKDGSS